MRHLQKILVVALTFGFPFSSVAQQVLKVGTQPSATPFSFFDKKSSSFQGLMVEAISEVATGAGIRIEFQPLPPSEMISALTSKKIDVSAGTITITPERKQVIAFSDPITSYAEALVVEISDTKKYTSMEELRGMSVAANAGSSYLDLAKNAGATVRTYLTSDEILRAVSTGEVQAAIMNSVVVTSKLRQGSFPQVQIVRSYKPVATAELGFSVRKTDVELVKQLNTSLARLRADGTIKKILGKWGAE